MANKIFNMEGGKHSAAAYSAFENEVFGGTAVASSKALKVTAKSAMTVTVAKGNGLIDTGDMYSRRIQVSTDTDLTISTADTSLPRIDYVVIYVDNSVRPSTDQLDNTNNILKIVDIKGTPAASPAKPTESAIQTAIGSGNPYMILASIYIAAGATSISNANITDERPASPNVYYAPEIEHTTISWFGCTLDLRKYGKVVTLTCWQPLAFQVPQDGKEPGKIPAGWRPYEDIGFPILFYTVPNFQGRINISENGDWEWHGTSWMNPGLYPTIHATWMIP